MSTTEIANRLVDLCKKGDFETAQKELFADDAVGGVLLSDAGDDVALGGAVGLGDGLVVGGGVGLGEALDLPAAGLTLTFGFGPSLFTTADGDDRFGVAARRPEALVDLPSQRGELR